MPDEDRFLVAAQSVADSIAALARPAVGGARWETRSYTGKPQYSTGVFGGTAGVVFLFADLFRVTGDPKAREVAEAAAMWVEGQSKADLRDSSADAGLYFGLSGHGQMCLHLYEATGRERWLRDAQARARAVARASWPDAHVLSGSAGSVIFLLRLYQATADQSLLDAAVRAGDHITRTVESDDQGARWDWHRDGQVRFSAGFVHGASGIAYALAELWRFTGDTAIKSLVYDAWRWIETVALEDDRGICWNRWPGDPHRPRVQWCHGAPGIGLFAARAAEIFNDGDLRRFFRALRQRDPGRRRCPQQSQPVPRPGRERGALHRARPGGRRRVVDDAAPATSATLQPPIARTARAKCAGQGTSRATTARTSCWDHPGWATFSCAWPVPRRFICR